MSESPPPANSLALLQPPPKRRWHARRGRAACTKKLPPLHKDSGDDTDAGKSEGKKDEDFSVFQSSLQRAEALYGGRRSPTHRRSPSPERREKVVYQEPRENHVSIVETSPPLISIRETEAEYVPEAVVAPVSNDDKGEEESDSGAAYYVVSGVVGQATDMFFDESCDDGFASTCSAWSCHSHESGENKLTEDDTNPEEALQAHLEDLAKAQAKLAAEIETCEHERKHLQDEIASLESKLQVQRPMPPPPASGEGTANPVAPSEAAPKHVRKVVVARDRAQLAPSLDDLLLARPKGGSKQVTQGRGQARSPQPPRRMKLPPMESGPERRAPLTAR